MLKILTLKIGAVGFLFFLIFINFAVATDHLRENKSPASRRLFPTPGDEKLDAAAQPAALERIAPAPFPWEDKLEQELKSLVLTFVNGTQAQLDTVSPMVDNLKGAIEILKGFEPQFAMQEATLKFITHTFTRISLLMGDLHNPHTCINESDYNHKLPPPLDKRYLSPMDKRIEDLQACRRDIHQQFCDLVPSFQQDFPLNTPPPNPHKIETLKISSPLVEPVILILESLKQVEEYYATFRENLARGTREHHERLSYVRVVGERLGIYLIPRPVAYRITHIDPYGVDITRPKEGSSPTVKYDDILHFKRNVKKPSGQAHSPYTLNPGMEISVYLLQMTLTGVGVPPSMLLYIENLPHKIPRPGTNAAQAFLRAYDPNLGEADRKSARDLLDKDAHFQQEMDTKREHYFLQVSQFVKGSTLKMFLEKGDPESKIDRESYSALMIGSLLVSPADGHPSNFMVEEQPPYRLVEVDNDRAFANLVVQRNGISYLETKTILYCLTSLMGQAIHPNIREKILSYSPKLFILRWLKVLTQQNQRCNTMLDEDQSDQLSLPICFHGSQQTLYRMVWILDKIQKALKRDKEGKLTHDALLGEISPITHWYYNKMRRLQPGLDVLKLFESIYTPSPRFSLEEMLKLEPLVYDGRKFGDSLKDLGRETLADHLKKPSEPQTYMEREQSIEESLYQLTASDLWKSCHWEGKEKDELQSHLAFILGAHASQLQNSIDLPTRVRLIKVKNTSKKAASKKIKLLLGVCVGGAVIIGSTLAIKKASPGGLSWFLQKVGLSNFDGVVGFCNWVRK